MSEKRTVALTARAIRGYLKIREQVASVWNASVAGEFRTIVRTAGSDTARSAAFESTMRNVAAHVLGVYQLVEDIQTAGFQQHGIKPKCPSEGGCFACCCELVEVAPVEAAVVAWAVMCLEDERPATVKRLVDWSKRFSEILAANAGYIPVPTQYIKEHLRCPFLSDDNKCLVYDLRPSVCRTYVSEEGKIACHTALGEDKMAELMIPSVPEAGAAAGVALTVDGFTVVMQHAVAWFLGSPTTPIGIHDMDAVIEGLRSAAEEGDADGEER